LLIWGLGHLSLGDRRGWLLVLLQPAAIAALLIVASQLVEGTRWLAIFPPLVALLIVWLGQAVHAYTHAVELGAVRGGELQVALFLPLAVVALTLFWLLGGRHGSPAATVQAYIEAWVDGREEAATELFAAPPPPDVMAAEWQQHMDTLADLIDRSRETYGPASGLDRARPFDSLRVREDANLAPDPADRPQTRFVVELVRTQRIETTVLGIIPTAGQETVVVQPLLYIWLGLERQEPPFELPLSGLESDAWRIDQLELAGTAPS